MIALIDPLLIRPAGDAHLTRRRDHYRTLRKGRLIVIRQMHEVPDAPHRHLPRRRLVIAGIVVHVVPPGSTMPASATRAGRGNRPSTC
jgi:hypothetical protein